MTLLYIFSLTVLGGVVGVLVALLVLRGFVQHQERIMHLVSFAAGAMLSAAFFDLIPEAFEHFGGEGFFQRLADLGLRGPDVLEINVFAVRALAERVF